MRRRGFAVECLVLAAAVAALLLCMYAVCGVAPFGPSSLASMDANLQYLDFFAYLKDVLAGTASLRYSFSKVLGGPMVGVYAYYLASPFNLLVALFPKEQLPAFFDVLVLLKLACAAVTFRIFLEERNEPSGVRRLLASALAIAYALGQYSIAQASNIMWLDGVYLLPLSWLGVWRVVRGRSPVLLAVAAGASVLFNWYTGAINCLFAVLWFAVELALAWAREPRELTLARLWRSCLRFAFGMVVALLLASVLFVPAVLSMARGGEGGIELTPARFFGFLTSYPLTVLKGFGFGAVSGWWQVSLWCGSVALAGAVLGVADSRIARRTRIVRAAVLACFVLIFYVAAAESVFSLFKEVGSYWFRYSYGSIAAIVALAAEYWLSDLPALAPSADADADAAEAVSAEAMPTESAPAETTVAGRRVFGRAEALGLTPSGVIGLLVFAMGMIASALAYGWLYNSSLAQVCASAALLVVAGALCTTAIRRASRLGALALSVLVLGETLYGICALAPLYLEPNVAEYAAYTTGEQSQLQALSQYDAGLYRSSTTSTRETNSSDAEQPNLRSDYNGPLAYGYRSLSGYTSCADAPALGFLNKLGYRQDGRTLCVTDDALVGADALLGVKYVRSPYAVPGLELTDLPEENGKLVYESPYALPLALTYVPSGEVPSYDGDPFAYQEALWSELAGSSAVLYRRLSAERTVDASGSVSFSAATLPGGAFAYYANLPWSSAVGTVLNVNGAYRIGYARWLSPSVIGVPASGAATTLTVASEADGSSEALPEAQFVALDLSALGSLASALQQRAADLQVLNDGYVRVRASATSGEELFISMPYEENWQATVNGSPAELHAFADALVSVPLTGGNNLVELTYRVPGERIGRALSLLGLASLAASALAEKRAQQARAALG